MGSSYSVPEVSSSTFVHKWREHPPFSYSLKIQSFSQLENWTTLSDNKYQSRFFSSGGYNWRLVVYPKGNEKDNGSGFISMYVEIDSTNLMISTPPTEVESTSLMISKPPTEVFAELKFFVYNKKENNYFIQDVEVKRFNALKKVWGLSQVLPCDTFKNHENGYLFDGDECEFGVDVNVAPPFTNWEIVSFNEKLLHSKFSFTVKNFSELTEDVQISKTFSTGGRKWCLQLYPKGNSRANGGKWLSVFLHLADSETLETDENIFMQGQMRVLNPLGSNHLARQLSQNYNESSKGWGWGQFLSLAEVWKTYLDKEDALTIEAEFKLVSTTKYSPMI